MRMPGVLRSSVFWACGLLAACGEGNRGTPSLVVNALIDGPVLAGRAFPLTVTRRWPDSFVADPWSDAVLEPLLVRLEDVSTQQTGSNVEERRLYRAYAFEPGDLIVPAPSFVIRSAKGGPERLVPDRVVTGNELRLRVTSDLPAEPAGSLASLEPELPAPPRPSETIDPLTLATAVVALLLLLGAIGWRLRTRKLLVADVNARVDPPLAWVEGLTALRAATPRGRAEMSVWASALSDLLREVLAQAGSVRAPEMSTEEIISAPESRGLLGKARLALLAQVLGGCDRVKFARHMAAESERRALLDGARDVLSATAPGGRHE